MRMSCLRCGGLLVRERLFEADGMSSTEQIDCDRCVNCGSLEDTIIRANRLPSRLPLRSREPRGPRTHRTNPTVTSMDLLYKEAPYDIVHQQTHSYSIQPGSRDRTPLPHHCVGSEGGGIQRSDLNHEFDSQTARTMLASPVTISVDGRSTELGTGGRLASESVASLGQNTHTGWPSDGRDRGRASDCR